MRVPKLIKRRSKHSPASTPLTPASRNPLSIDIELGQRASTSSSGGGSPKPSPKRARSDPVAKLEVSRIRGKYIDRDQLERYLQHKFDGTQSDWHFNVSGHVYHAGQDKVKWS